MKIVAKTILNRLASKHAEDMYTEEIEAGISGLRIDAVAVKKSWANALVVGYEVKISRADFLQDDKLHRYKDFVNELYIVCPPKVISKDEVPEDVGLMYVSSTGNRVYTKKKASRRVLMAEKEATLYKRLLMRSEIRREATSYYNGESDRDYWKRWLDDRKEREVLGRSVSRKLRQIVEEEVARVDRRAYLAELQNKNLEEIKEMCQNAGIDPHPRALSNALAAINGEAPTHLQRCVRSLQESLEDLDKEIEENKKGKL